MNNNLIISTEVNEELIDICMLSEVDYSDYNKIFFIPEGSDSRLVSSLNGEVVFKKRLTNIKIVQKFYDVLQLFFLVLRVKPKVLFTGSSMFKYRFMSWLFNVYHVCYFRGLMFDAKNKSGISDLIRYSVLERLGISSYFFNCCEADSVLTVSYINKDFILSRGVDAKKVKIVSPPWLSGLKKIEVKSGRVKKIIFISQAFKEHGFDSQHSSQLRFLTDLDDFCYKKKIELSIRVHPRDFTKYSDICFLSKPDLLSSQPKDFLNSLDGTELILTPLSTVAFEIIHMGGNVVFYSTKELDELYFDAYERLDIKRIYGFNNLDLKLDRVKNKNNDLFCG